MSFRSRIRACALCALLTVSATPQFSAASSWFTLDKTDGDTEELQALTTYKLVYNDITLGELDTQTYVGGVMLPMTDLSRILKFKIEINEPEGTANGRMNGRPFAIDLGKHIIVADNVERSFSDEQARFINGTLYIDTTLLGNMLPVAFNTDLSTLTVTLHPESSFGIFAKLDQTEDEDAAPPLSKEVAEPAPPQPKAPPTPPAPAIAATPQKSEIAKTLPTPSSAPKAIPAPTPPAPKSAPTPAPTAIKPAEPVTLPAPTTPKEEVKPAPAAPPVASEPAPAPAPLLQGDDVVEGTVMPLPKQAVPPVKVTPPGTPEPAPAMPTVVQKESPSGAQENANTEDIAKDAAADAKPVPPRRKSNVYETAALKDSPLEAIPEAPINDETLLILTPKIRSFSYPEYVEGYRHPHGVYLPLGTLAKVLEFPIVVDPVKGTASGWFIREKNTFALDAQTRKATVKKETIEFPEGMTKTTDFDILVDAALLSRMLPLDITVNFSQMALVVNPREQLPLEARIKREKVWKNLKARATANAPDYPVKETPYVPYSVPMADLTLSQGYDTRRKVDKSFTNYNLLASAGLGYMDTNLFVAGNTAAEDIQVLRFKAGRRDRDGKVLGDTVPITDLNIGDINSYAIPLVASTSLGRGVAFTNRDLRRGGQFDVTNFVGDAKPDWEIELYQNSALIDFQVVGTNGRYEFLNVPVYYGNNEYRLVFYGPQGETYEQVTTRYIGDSMLKPGEVDYTFSLDDKSSSLFNLGDAIGDADERGMRAVTEAEVGLTENLTGSVGLAHLPVETGDSNYLSLGLRSNIKGVFLGTNLAYDETNSGYAARVTGITRQAGINLRADQRYYSDFLSEESVAFITRPANTLLSLDPFGDNDPNNPNNLPLEYRLQSRSEFDANTTLPAGPASITTGLNLLREEFENGDTDYTLSHRVSTSLRGLNIGNTLAFHNYEARTPLGESIDGNLSFRGKFWDYLLRVGLQYGVQPETELEVINATLQKNIAPDIRGTLRLRHVIGDLTDRTEVGAILNWDFDTFSLSPRMQVDNNGDVFAGLTLVVSMGHEPRENRVVTSRRSLAGGGAVSAVAFLDDNVNGIRDENEQTLPGVIFRGARASTTNEQGVAFIDSVGADLPVPLRIDTSTLEDPLWVATPEAYNVIPHAGTVTQVDFPVIRASEIEGETYLNTNEGQIPYPSLNIELLDAKNNVVRTLRSEYDGYFYISNVIPGDYTLRVAPKELEGKDLAANTIPLHITSQSQTLSGQAIVVHRTGESALLKNTAQTEAETKNADASEETFLAEEKKPLPAQEKAVDSKTTATEPVAPASATPPPTSPVVPIAQANIEKTAVGEPARNTERFVQLGLFKQKANADKTLESLAGRVPPGEIVTEGEGEARRYRVRVGPFADLKAAQAARDELKKQGFKDAYIP